MNLTRKEHRQNFLSL